MPHSLTKQQDKKHTQMMVKEAKTTLGTLCYLHAAGRNAAFLVQIILGKSPDRRKPGGWIAPSLKTTAHAQWEV